ncbi:putative protein containing caspase domain protein [Salinivirga cyanobacteriivorans]|uniref:Peptidase C14 caspase domain-containing protein n=1 Tax=Salinivirga cyanobacteriivorans TaxID=1307839 RepID=A0A0S2HYU8_9BACT|nr:caspase family protein [Salinivirga cyanobacteriivorans]ALO15232.1 putative protein containing caspase domain protein [Salinivirga cyanobacteriivorans]
MKHILKIFALTVIILTCNTVRAQFNNIMLLNKYKSIVLKPEKRNAEYNDYAEQIITKHLTAAGFPKPLDKSILYTNQGSSCEILTCNYLVKNASNVAVEVRTNLEFINCEYETVFEIDETTKASFYTKKSVKKSIDNALKVFKNFTYDYQPDRQEANDFQQEAAGKNVSRKTLDAENYKFQKLSSVDQNIPRSASQKHNRFALIIGNEDYSSHQKDLAEEVNVAYARNDASAFKLYAQNLLGIPEQNITFLLDATTGQMNQAIAKLKLILKNTNGNADVFVYYAGHGLPDDKTKAPYLMPVDVSGKNPELGISLQGLYTTLAEFPSEKVTVFIDACFSGGARNQGLLAARGVKIKPRKNTLRGNIVSFTASSGNQSSLPYHDEQHGFFTFYLLKKFQESKGDITYGALSDYLKKTVALKSILINEKEQTPQTNVSIGIVDEWETWKLNP